MGSDVAIRFAALIAKKALSAASHAFPGEESQPGEQSSLQKGGAVDATKEGRGTAAAMPPRLHGDRELVRTRNRGRLPHPRMLNEIKRKNTRAFFTRAGRVSMLGH